MKNFEKYYEELLNIGFDDFVPVDNVPVRCNAFRCIHHCNANGGFDCDKIRKEWLFAEHKQADVDWTKIEVDTPILVSEDNEEWFKRHFAKFENSKVYAWNYGNTSWSAKSLMWAWKYAKLVENEDKENE